MSSSHSEHNVDTVSTHMTPGKAKSAAARPTPNWKTKRSKHVKKPKAEKSVFAAATSRSTHAMSHVNVLVPQSFLQQERVAESMVAAGNAVEAENIFDMLKPKTDLSDLISQSIEQISKELESVVDGQPDVLERRLGKQPELLERESGDRELRRFLSPQECEQVAGRPEAAMYPGIRALVLFASNRLSAIAGELGLPLCTTITVHESFDRKPEDSDDLSRIDLALKSGDRTSRLGGQLPDNTLSYANMIGIVEAKAGNTESDELDALAQLYRYSRNLYYCQLNRRFVWGLTFCGTTARACLLSPDNMFKSGPMDVHTCKGREEFVGLLVRMSTCAVDCLGYDTSIWYDE
ncbi:hypothetical protein IW150_003491, partial [Coemansia sp. RSA 2607]